MLIEIPQRKGAPLHSATDKFSRHGVTAESLAGLKRLSGRHGYGGERAGLGPADLDLLEINEVFAAQALAGHKQSGWDTPTVNVNDGAIAIGHPIGSSGRRIVMTQRLDANYRGRNAAEWNAPN